LRFASLPRARAVCGRIGVESSDYSDGGPTIRTYPPTAPTVGPLRSKPTLMRLRQEP